MTVPPEPFDLISPPDAQTNAVRATLSPDALDLVQQLLLLRRALIVLMQATGIEALALPFVALVEASLLPLRVTHDPATLPNLLQLKLPGEGLLTLAHAPTPGAGYDSDGAPEAERLRAALGEARQLLVNDGGRDTVLALIDATLRP